MGLATTSIFDHLPGVEVPVGDISTALSRVWEVPSTDPTVNLSEFRATQMNLILHLGLRAEPEEARELFETALRFSRRYPCRILMLVPEVPANEETLLSSKIFSECYIGKSGRERSCYEAIILAYPPAVREFLEDQVSILLENDLPTYYWQYGFKETHRVNEYEFFFNVARRVVYDSRQEGAQIREIEWVKPEIVRDLAVASQLPVRQAIGQFLSRFEPGELVRGLKRVRVRRSKKLEIEALILRDWVKEALSGCAELSKQELTAEFDCCPSGGVKEFELELEFESDDQRYFKWIANRKTGVAEIDADLGRGRNRIPTALKLFPLEDALAEALLS